VTPATQSPTVRTSATANNGAEGTVHAYASNGDLFILDGGVYWRFDSLSAWSRWFDAVQSSIPSTQERARQIRAAMDEAFPQEQAA